MDADHAFDDNAVRLATMSTGTEATAAAAAGLPDAPPLDQQQQQQQQQRDEPEQRNASVTRAVAAAGGVAGGGEPASHFRVVVRVRPLSELELSKTGDRAVVCGADAQTLHVARVLDQLEDQSAGFSASGGGGGSGLGALAAGWRPISFHQVWSEIASQEEVFEQSGVKDLVLRAIDGYNATVFAFGQTGSGKTFTITGPEEGLYTSLSLAGIIPRALEFLFQQVQALRDSSDPGGGAEAGLTVNVRAAFLEIYNEQVQDLLNPGATGLAIRWTAAKGFYVESLFVADCEALDDCMAVLEEGMRNRTTGSHRLNENSSRSHSVMTVYVDTCSIDAEDGAPVRKHGKISFVDLAGSEKVKESKATGDTLTETLNINKSLLTLGNCISALADPSKRGSHIPYRDSKLTKLLSDSLGGSGLVLMIACVSPSSINLSETIKTLRYAHRAKRIQGPQPLRQSVDPVRDTVLQLRRELKGLRRENAELRALVGGGGTTSTVATTAAASLPHVRGPPAAKLTSVAEPPPLKLPRLPDAQSHAAVRPSSSQDSSEPSTTSPPSSADSWRLPALQEPHAPVLPALPHPQHRHHNRQQQQQQLLQVQQHPQQQPFPIQLDYYLAPMPPAWQFAPVPDQQARHSPVDYGEQAVCMLP
ncbi:Kinesin- protein 12 [Cladochytrium tenue]|nr:Kinesin- protein 12 [Cladochytrium tenue]